MRDVTETEAQREAREAMEAMMADARAIRERIARESGQ